MPPPGKRFSLTSSNSGQRLLLQSALEVPASAGARLQEEAHCVLDGRDVKREIWGGGVIGTWVGKGERGGGRADLLENPSGERSKRGASPERGGMSWMRWLDAPAPAPAHHLASSSLDPKAPAPPLLKKALPPPTQPRRVRLFPVSASPRPVSVTIEFIPPPPLCCPPRPSHALFACRPRHHHSASSFTGPPCHLGPARSLPRATPSALPYCTSAPPRPPPTSFPLTFSSHASLPPPVPPNPIPTQLGPRTPSCTGPSVSPESFPVAPLLSSPLSTLRPTVRPSTSLLPPRPAPALLPPNSRSLHPPSSEP